MTTLLVIDDDPAAAELIQVCVSDWTVLSALSGIVGLDRLREQKQPIDAIVLDVDMPDLDGWDTAVQIRHAAPTIPVLIYTSLDDRNLDEYMTCLDCTVVRKGIDPGVLTARLRALPQQQPNVRFTPFLQRLQIKIRSHERAVRQQRRRGVVVFAELLSDQIGYTQLLERSGVPVVAVEKTIPGLERALAFATASVLVAPASASQSVQPVLDRSPLATLFIARSLAEGTILRHLSRGSAVVRVLVETPTLTPTIVRDAVTATAHDQPFIDPVLDQHHSSPSPGLTPQEQRVRALEGVPDDIVAATLGISTRSVQQYRSRIRGKLADRLLAS